MYKPTVDQVGGVLRALLAVLGGILVNRGILDDTTWLAVSGGLVAIGVALWSYYTNRPAKIVETATAQPKDIVGAVKAAQASTAPSQ